MLGTAASSIAKFPGKTRNAAGLLLSRAMVVLEHPSPAADDAPGVPRVPRLGPPQGWGFGGQRQSHSCCSSRLPSYMERDEPASTEAAGMAVRSVLRSAMESGFRATQGAAPAPPSPQRCSRRYLQWMRWRDASCTCRCFRSAAPGSRSLCWMGAGRWHWAFGGLEGVGWVAQKPPQPDPELAERGAGGWQGPLHPWALAPREGEERWRQPRFMLPAQERREEGDSQGQRQRCQISQ